MKIIFALILSLTSLGILPPNSSGEIIDRIVAEVNDNVITLSELNEYGKPFFHKIMATAPADIIEAEIQKARTELLELMIDDLILEQEAKKFDLVVQDFEVEGAIASIRSENSVTPEQFREELQKMGTTEEAYRAKLKKQLLKSRLVNIEIRSRLVITDEKIKEYYDSHYQKDNQTPEGYHILQIGLSWGEKSHYKSQDEALYTARVVKNFIDEGEDFKLLAKKYSDLPSAEDGGDIGVFTKEEMAQYMLAAIKDMQPGDSSEIIETPSGFQILKLMSENIDGVVVRAPLASVKSDIQEILYRQEMEKMYDKWMAAIREKAYIRKNL